MKRMIAVITMMLMVASIGMSGCSKATGFLGAEGESAVETITSKELFIPMEKMRTLNPVLTRDETAYYLHKLIYQGLFSLDENLSAVGVLAESYRYSEDGKTVILSLRDDVRWQDGTRFTAQDVKFSIDAYLSVVDPALQSVYTPFVSVIASAKVTDTNQIEINFRDPKNAAIENLIFPIFPSSTAAKPSLIQLMNTDFQPIGTGAYRVETDFTAKQITLVGNEEYKGSMPENTLRIKYIPSEEDAVNLFEVREFHLAFLKEGDRDALLDDRDASVVSFPSNEAEVIGFRFQTELLKDRRVRQAISYAIDSQKIIDSCYYGSGVPNDTIYYPNYLGIETQKPLHAYQIEKAATILSDAGYSKEDLTLRLLVNADQSERVLAAKMIQGQLKLAGFSVEVVSVPTAEFASAFALGQYDLFLSGYRFAETYDLRTLLKTGQNQIGYSNTTLDALLDQLQSGLAAGKKEKTFKSIRTILRDDVPYYCLLYKTYGLAVSSDLTGQATPRFDDIYHGSDRWSLQYEVTKSE